MTTIARTTASTQQVRPGTLGTLHRTAALVTRSLARARSAVATAIVRGQMGPVYETEIGRRTGARI